MSLTKSLSSGPRILYLFAVLIAASSAQARDRDTGNLLAKMRAAYTGVKSARLSTETHAGKVAIECTVYYRPAMNVRADISNLAGAGFTGVAVVSTDGKSISVKAPGSPQRKVPFALDGLEQSIPGNLETYCFFDSARQLSTQKGKNMEHSILKILPNQTWKGKKWIVLEENAPAQKIVCHYFVDPATSLIWRTTVRRVGEGSDALDAQITHLDLGASVAPSLFKPA
jgi:hypothetical protein